MAQDMRALLTFWAFGFVANRLSSTRNFGRALESTEHTYSHQLDHFVFQFGVPWYCHVVTRFRGKQWKPFYVQCEIAHFVYFLQLRKTNYGGLIVNRTPKMSISNRYQLDEHSLSKYLQFVMDIFASKVRPSIIHHEPAA